MFDVSYLLRYSSDWRKKKVKKKKVSWLAPRPREKKRKEKPPLCLERTVAQEWPELELFFFSLGILLPFSNVFPGREYGDRIRLLSLAELAAPSKQSLGVLFFSLPHLLFHQPHCWPCLDPFFLPPTAWGLMRWWNFPFPAFFFLLDDEWFMSGKMAACCVCHLDGGVPRELLPFLLNPALRYGDLHFCNTTQLSQKWKCFLWVRGKGGSA